MLEKEKGRGDKSERRGWGSGKERSKEREESILVNYHFTRSTTGISHFLLPF